MITVIASIALVALAVIGTARLFLHVGGELQRLKDAVDDHAQQSIKVHARLLSAEQEREQDARLVNAIAGNLDGAREDIQQLFDATHTRRKRKI